MRSLLILLFIGTTTIFAQEGVIRFRFNDSILEKRGEEKFVVTFVNEKTMEKVSISTTFADYIDAFRLKRLPTGKYTMLFQFTSLQDFEMRGIPVNSDRITFLEDFELEEKSVNKSIIIKTYKEPFSYKCG